VAPASCRHRRTPPGRRPYEEGLSLYFANISRSDLVIDSHMQNEGNGWAGSDANPWHLDEDTESILFLTNESDKPARIGSKVSAHGVTYEVAEKRHSIVILGSPDMIGTTKDLGSR
jgi:hypothetical protein